MEIGERRGDDRHVSCPTQCQSLIDHRASCQTRTAECQVDRKDEKREWTNLIKELREHSRGQAEKFYDRLREIEKTQQELASQVKDAAVKAKEDSIKLDELHKTLMMAKGAKIAVGLLITGFIVLFGWLFSFWLSKH